jgi:hypothetical protein
VAGAQRGLDLLRPLICVPLAAGPAQRGGNLAARQRPPGFGAGRDRQYRDRVTGGEVGAERFQRGRVVLPQRRAQRVDLSLPRPDRGLVRAGQHPDRVSQVAVPGDLPVVMPVGTD